MRIRESSFAHLISLIQKLSLAQSLDELTSVITRAARELTHSDGTTFVLRDGDMCHYVDENAISPLWKGQKFPMSMCISGWVMINRQSVVIEDIFQDHRVPVDAYRPTFVKSLAMVPVRTNSPIGAIGVYWAKQYRPAEDQLAVLRALADSVSIAIENLNLYNQLKMHLKDLETANRGKDEFLMMLSHELRTPLNSILGFSSLLATGALDGDEVKAKMAAKTIEHNALAQSRIINDILDATRIISGRFTLEKNPISMADLVALGVESVRSMALEKGITIVTDMPGEPLGQLLGDRVRLQQVLWNLLTNAIKFTQQGGKIEVRLLRMGPNIHIQVNDNGKGIDSQMLSKIFDRFYQVDSSSVRQHSGLGLGLAITKHLVEAHGGSIIASSKGLGEGAVFEVSLPLATIAAKSTLQADSSTKKILEGVNAIVVDDDQDAQRLVSLILCQYGAKVETVGRTREAMKIMMASHKDILICDYNMPEEDGFSFMRRIRSQGMYDDAKLPAIALTAYADKEHEKSAMAAGFDAFIGKPLQPLVLLDTTRMLLSR